MHRFSSGWLRSAVGAVLVFGSVTAFPQGSAYPSKPVKIIVPSGPGGPADIILRTINAKMAEQLGQPVILEYRAGASGTIGLNSVVRSAPDGYTIVLVSETHTAAESLYFNRGYTMTRDLVPVSVLVNMPSVLVVNKNLPVKSVPELLAMAKAQPNKLSFASGGNGNTYHLAAELMQQKSGVQLMHVPYSQAGTGRTDVLSGQVDMMFDALISMQPHITSGGVRAIAVTSPQRLPSLPAVPTVSESGVPGYEMEIWFGLMAPAGTPPAVLTRLNEAVTTSLQDKAVVAQLAGGALKPITATPSEFGEMIRISIDKWGSVIKAGGVKAE